MAIRRGIFIAPGTAPGTVGAAALARTLSVFLCGLKETDVAIAALAAWIPARRAARVTR
jgi:hypothetical protein